MASLTTRLDRAERARGPRDASYGPLPIINPDAWPDAVRAAYDAGDAATRDQIIWQMSGERPCPAPIAVIEVRVGVAP